MIKVKTGNSCKPELEKRAELDPFLSAGCFRELHLTSTSSNKNLNHVSVIIQKPKWNKYEKEGQLASAYFSPNYKIFDLFFKIKKNENTVLNLVFKAFPQSSIPPLASIILGIINLSGLRSKVRSLMYLSGHPLKVQNFLVRFS